MFSSFAKDNLMQKAGREEKVSVFKLRHNFWIDLVSIYIMKLMY